MGDSMLAKIVSVLSESCAIDLSDSLVINGQNIWSPEPYIVFQPLEAL